MSVCVGVVKAFLNDGVGNVPVVSTLARCGSVRDIRVIEMLVEIFN